MGAEGSITRLIERLHADDDRVVQQQIWDRYFRRLVGLARKKLGDAQRRAEDEEDIALSALDSFFSGARREQFPDLRDRNNLWLILSTITARKAINQIERQFAQKRGGGKVRGESAFHCPSAEETPAGLSGFADDEPTPEEVAELCEECQLRLDSLNDSVLRTIAVRKLQNYTNVEIAAELGVVKRTVERKLSRIRKLWSEDRVR